MSRCIAREPAGTVTQEQVLSVHSTLCNFGGTRFWFNACPKCGAEIPSSGMSHDVGDQPLHQDATCPKCGAKLTRNVGDAWREDKRP